LLTCTFVIYLRRQGLEFRIGDDMRHVIDIRLYIGKAGCTARLTGEVRIPRCKPIR